MDPVSHKSELLARAVAPLLRYYGGPLYQQNVGRPGVSDFAFGNPHDMPLAGLSQALERAIVPQNKDWFAYKNNEPNSRALVARALTARDGLPYDPEDVFMTSGAFGGLCAIFDALLDPGDEVVFNVPPWFFYEAMILDRQAVPVRVRVQDGTWDLDLEAIARALGPKTRAVLVNSPHNPTGRIYPAEMLRELGQLLEAHGRKHGRPVILLSDEAYSRIVFSGQHFESPALFYPHTVVVYTYGKTLLAPGERIGYLALPPHMPAASRAALRRVLMVCQMVNGWAFPGATLQHALGDLDGLCIDVPRIERRRDRLVCALRGWGYEVHDPQGTFYLLPRSPIPDDWAFAERLAEKNVLAMPGEVLELPGYFRLSLTASDDMVERALPALQAAIAEMPQGR